MPVTRAFLPYVCAPVTRARRQQSSTHNMKTQQQARQRDWLCSPSGLHTQTRCSSCTLRIYWNNKPWAWYYQLESELSIRGCQPNIGYQIQNWHNVDTNNKSPDSLNSSSHNHYYSIDIAAAAATKTTALAPSATNPTCTIARYSCPQIQAHIYRDIELSSRASKAS